MVTGVLIWIFEGLGLCIDLVMQSWMQIVSRFQHFLLLIEHVTL